MCYTLLPGGPKRRRAQARVGPAPFGVAAGPSPSRSDHQPTTYQSCYQTAFRYTNWAPIPNEFSDSNSYPITA